MNKITNPKHYTSASIDCIDAINGMTEQNPEGAYHRGSILKYLWRCFDKGDALTDLKKARWFINDLIERLEKKRSSNEEIQENLR